jgi:hypothetical protein
MVTDFIAAAEAAAKSAVIAAKSLRDMATAIAVSARERRTGFSDREAGDFLTQPVAARVGCLDMESYAQGFNDGYAEATAQLSPDNHDEPTTCYLCGQRTDNLVDTSDDDREYVCPRCNVVAPHSSRVSRSRGTSPEAVSADRSPAPASGHPDTALADLRITAALDTFEQHRKPTK